MTQMIQYLAFYRDEKNTDPKQKQCLCIKPMPNKKPVTIKEEDFLGYCVDDSSLNITVGEGRIFDESTAKEWYVNDVMDVEDKSECCSKCISKNSGTKMFYYLKSERACACYKIDQSIQPVTLAVETTTATCGDFKISDFGDTAEKTDKRDSTVSSNTENGYNSEVVGATAEGDNTCSTGPCSCTCL